MYVCIVSVSMYAMYVCNVCMYACMYVCIFVCMLFQYVLTYILMRAIFFMTSMYAPYV